MPIVKYAPFIIVGLYTLFLLFMVFNANFRKNLQDAHKETKFSSYSWTRYASSFLILSAVVIIFAQVLGQSEVNFPLVSLMLTVAMGGKLVHSKNADGTSILSMNKTNGVEKEVEKPIVEKPIIEEQPLDEKTEENEREQQP